jgi:putative transposase
MAYSVDLREKVIRFIEQGGGKSEAGRVFGIAECTVYAWLTKKKTTGVLHDAKLIRKHKKIDPVSLLKYIEDRPDATLKEMAGYFGAAPQSVWEMLKKLKITRKKRPSCTGRGMKKSVKYLWQVSKNSRQSN